MTLFNCSECGYEFSDKADGCPKCGCPNSPGGMTPIGPPPGKKLDGGKLGKVQKIVLTVVLSTIFVPVMFLAPIFCRELLNSWVWEIWNWIPIPIAVLQPLAIALALLGFAIPCGFFAWIVSRIWIR